MKRLKYKFKWYIGVFAALLLLYSALCWAKSLKYAVTEGIGSNFDSFWSSAMYKKEDVSGVNQILTYLTTGQASATQVKSGKDGWLFFNTARTVNDYNGSDVYSGEELSQMLSTALGVQSELGRREINSVIIVAPNKSNVYFDQVLDDFSYSETSRTEKMIEYLAASGVNIISLKDALLEGKSSWQIYYSYDTHWNQLGAYIGVKEALASFDIEISPLSERTVSSMPLRECYHHNAIDDLAIIAGLEKILDDDVEYIIDGTASIDWSTLAVEQNERLVSHFTNPGAQLDSTVFVVGDSFSTSMLPELCEVFSNVYVVHRDGFKPSQIDEFSPDYVIFEYLERYSDQLASVSLN